MELPFDEREKNRYIKIMHKLDCKIDKLEAENKQLQNTSSNNKYTAPQATPKSCPSCNSESILKNEKHNHYGCLACHHEWA